VRRAKGLDPRVKAVHNTLRGQHQDNIQRPYQLVKMSHKPVLLPTRYPTERKKKKKSICGIRIFSIALLKQTGKKILGLEVASKRLIY